MTVEEAKIIAANVDRLNSYIDLLKGLEYQKSNLRINLSGSDSMLGSTEIIIRSNPDGMEAKIRSFVGTLIQEEIESIEKELEEL